MTLDGRGYYRITSLLKQVGLSFRSLVPGRALPAGVKVAITTRAEKHLVGAPHLLTLEELPDSQTLKQEIVKRIHSSRNVVLTVGIDPGSRIGVAGYYGRQEIYSDVLASPKEVVERVMKLLELNGEARKVIRVGDGSPRVADEIARGLLSACRRDARIEIIDERGTSSLASRGPNRRGARDVRSAGMIAFREGEMFPIRDKITV